MEDRKELIQYKKEKFDSRFFEQKQRLKEFNKEQLEKVKEYYQRTQSSQSAGRPTFAAEEHQMVVNEDRIENHKQNMIRRQRIQQGYKHLLVDNLMSKKMRAENMIKMKQETVKQLSSKNSNIQSHWFETAQSVAKTLQPVTFETHYSEFEAERKRKIKAKLEGNAA